MSMSTIRVLRSKRLCLKNDLRITSPQKLLSSSRLTVPDQLDIGGTFHLLLLPVGLVPVQVEEYDDQARHQIQMLVEPVGLEDAFGDVKLGGSLQNQHLIIKGSARSLASKRAAVVTLFLTLGYSWSPSSSL